MAKEYKQDVLLIAQDVRLSRVHAQRYFLDSCLSNEKMDVFGKRVLFRNSFFLHVDDKN